MATQEQRTQADIVRLANRGLDIPTLAQEARRVLEKAVPTAGACWLVMDPASLMPIGYIGQNDFQPQVVPRLAMNEYVDDDVNRYASLVHGPKRIATLSAATEGHLDRSVRYREVFKPTGYGDEIRVALMDGGLCWGALVLHGEDDGRMYDARAVRVVESASTALAQGIRKALLLRAATSDAPDAPGLVVMDQGNEIESVTAPADHWLGEMYDVPMDARDVPTAIYHLASQARRSAVDGSPLPKVHVPTSSGRWLSLHASMLGPPEQGRVAIIVEPAHPMEIAPLIMKAYGLTDREAEVTRLVLNGFSSSEIAGSLFVTPYTVQDHLKSIFTKMGVSSRRELAAMILFTHHLPGLPAQAPAPATARDGAGNAFGPRIRTA